MLDHLARELDVIVVISAGNVSEPVLNDFTSRDELMEHCRDQLFMSGHRLIDPATAALGITVGSITRFDEPALNPRGIASISAGKKEKV